MGNNQGSQTGGPEGQINNYSHDNLLKENRAQSSSGWKHSRAKGSLPKKATIEKKGKTLPLCSNLKVAEGEDVEVDEGVDG